MCSMVGATAQYAEPSTWSLAYHNGFNLPGGPFGPVPELMFEKKSLILVVRLIRNLADLLRSENLLPDGNSMGTVLIKVQNCLMILDVIGGKALSNLACTSWRSSRRSNTSFLKKGAKHGHLY